MIHDILAATKLLLFIAVPVLGILFLVHQCVYKNHTVTESSPTSNLELMDIQYKGHTYIYVKSFYSRTIVHAEHCKCKK